MFENPLLLYTALLIIAGLAYFIFFYKKGRKHYFYEESNIPIQPTLASQLSQKFQENFDNNTKKVNQILEKGNQDMTYIIVLPKDVELIETEACLLIKGTTKSILAIGDELALMEQLPQGYCMQIGNWHFFVLNDTTQSSREDKLVVMPPDHWLFMSCKFRDSLLGEDVHPYQYNFEPFTFKKVLKYGIGVEATDYQF